MKKTILCLLSVFAQMPTHAMEARFIQSKIVIVELYDQGTKVDEVAVRVRDVDTGKMAQIRLLRNKIEPQTLSSFFIFEFLKGDLKPRSFQFVSLKGQTYLTQVGVENGAQKVSLFASDQEWQNYSLSQMPVKSTETVKATNVAVIEQKVREVVRTQEMVQLRIEEQQAKKRAEEIQAQELLSEQEKQKNRERASQQVQLADAAYKRQNFSEAQSLYEKASSLDPANESYLYRYGVSLYKTGHYNQSLATLSMADVSSELLLEKDYYIALNRLKLKDYDKAAKDLNEIKEENDPELSPTAAYLAGTIEFQRQKFSDARKNMEYVLDNSKDPQMDKAAEEMLEKLDRMENFIASQKEKYRFTLFAGPVYDQNVLNIASNNVATDVQAFRANYGVSGLGVWHRTETSDFGTQISLSDYYSTNTQFKGDAVLQTADPLELTLTLPYHKEFIGRDRSVNWELLPTYKSLYLSPTGGTRDEVIRSLGVSTILASPLTRDIFLSGKLDAYTDTSYLNPSSSDDRQTGSKYGLTVSPLKLLDAKGDRSASLDLSYLINQTEGRNYRYQRLGLGASYNFPGRWKSLSTIRADYSQQMYPEAVNSRTDSTVALSYLMNKELSKSWRLSATVQYTMARSELALYEYNKLMVMSLFTYTLSVLDK